MRISFLSYYSGSVERGAETFVRELSQGLTQFGHEVSVHTNENFDEKNIKNFTQKALAQIGKTDILFPVNGRWQSVLCRLWALNNKSKLVISGQSGPGLDDRINLWTFPSIFVCLTKFQASWAKRANPLVQTAIIPNGVDLDRFTPSVEPINVHLPEPIILNVAALVDSKQQELAIRAVSKLSSGSLLLVGKGPDEKKLETLGRSLLPGRFKIISLPFDQIHRIYTTSTLFTFPTVSWESFGIVMLEAMAAGIPVVATNDPIRREIVGNAGLFVDPTNLLKYAESLQKALDTKWGEKPRLQAEKFSWANITRKYDVLFKNLINL